eukprot:TRINITY_DN12175_c0_g1_i3.p2 TRINITY_DN12175_c0_g1~~TRINITY_DN12175_c0_g1_i3.p2  ORF type:complete len:183 (+),score=14.67 TRINITY_DN12175_c0_g1_i3:26-550(+)
MMGQLYEPLNYLGTQYRAIQQYMIDMENMFQMLFVVPDVKDGNEVLVVDKVEGCSVEVENVSFGYPGNHNVLKNVSLTVPAGNSVALVGETGSGKSSMLRLLFRFYDPLSGVIRINNQNIKSFTLQSLRKVIGMVPQDAVLFNDTVKYNIRYGRTDANEEEVIQAARNAALHEQ